MQAFIYERYEPAERLRMVEVDPSMPDAGEVLVKVLAASVNAADWHCLAGTPLFSRATLGWRRPKHKILGVDVAGQVAAGGSNLTASRPATRSMPPPGPRLRRLRRRRLGASGGLAANPPGLTFQEAAAVTGFTSLARLLGGSLSGGTQIAQVNAKELELLSGWSRPAGRAPGPTGATASPSSPQPSPTWSRATPRPRSSLT